MFRVLTEGTDFEGVMARTGALGNLIYLRLLADQAHKLRGTAALIAGVFGRTADCGSGV